jgi:hypothetical protein
MALGQEAVTVRSVAELRDEVARLRSALRAAEEQLAARADAERMNEVESVGITATESLPYARKLTQIAERITSVHAQGGFDATAAENSAVQFPVWSYSVRLPVLFGHDDNPLGLSNEVPRRRGLSHRDSTFIEMNPSLAFTLTESETSQWVFEYNLDKYYYLEQADINSLVNELAVRHIRKLGERDTIFVTAADQLKRVDEEGKYNQVLASLGWRHTWRDKRNASDVKYTFTSTEFELPDNSKIPAVLDPDNDTHGIGLAHTYILRADSTSGGKELALSGGYAFLTTNADGDDQDVDRHRISLELTGSPVAPGPATERNSWQQQLHKLQVQAKYVHDFDDYQHKTSTAGAGFAFARSANIDRASLSLTYPIGRQLNWEQQTAAQRRRGPVQALWIATYTYSRSDVNIFGEDKDNHVIKAGIIADF